METGLRRVGGEVTQRIAKAVNPPAATSRYTLYPYQDKHRTKGEPDRQVRHG